MDGAPPVPTQQGREIYQRSSAPLIPRTHAATARFFEGYELLDPGLVWLADWRPDGESHAAVSHGYGGLGLRP